MKQRIISLALALTALLALAGCGASGGGTAVPADMEAMQQAMTAADPSLPEMLSVTSKVSDAKTLFTYLSDLDYEKVEGYLLSYSSSGTADEIAVIQVRDPADANEARASLEKHRDDRLKLFRTYGPDEAARVEQGVIGVSGPYAYLVICDGSEAVIEAFDAYLNGLTAEG